MDIQRNILIVDDSKNIDRDIKSYNYIFGKLKEVRDLDYNLIFYSRKKYEEAIELLQDPDIVFDVVIVDHNLSEGGNEHFGDDLIQEIRQHINKHCKLIFYSMGDLAEIFPNRLDLINLFNLGIFRFLSKDMSTSNTPLFGSGQMQLRVETIIDAIQDIDFVQVTLERYFAEYREVISDEMITVAGRNYSVNEIINLIKKDADEGRLYKSNLAESVIIHNILTGGK